MNNAAIWIISGLSIAGVIIRPFKCSEAYYAITGAILLIIFKLLNPAGAIAGVLKGLDVYLFLIGMMLLAETAREERLFDWLAAHATLLSRGSSVRLFALIYLVGIFVTTFLSNDAAAVVLTPAVAAAVKAAKIEKPLPYLLICAFIANAASFVLPISNPANLVIYGEHMPALGQWLSYYTLPSIAAILVTYFSLYYTQREDLKQKINLNISLPPFEDGAKAAMIGIGFTAVLLLVCSALDYPLGLPTAVTGILTSLLVLLRSKKSPVKIIKGVSWGVIPLVAGLFVIVEALNQTGLTSTITAQLNVAVTRWGDGAVWLVGGITALGCNLMNNLPAGLIAGNVMQQAHSSGLIQRAVLIGVDIGPNLSITGSLATILWLVALRKEKQDVSAWQFLKIGSVVMTLALLSALACLFI